MNKHYLIFFISLFSLSLLAQEKPIDLITNRLDIYSTVNPIEKIFIHTDKSQYSIGESIWFKVYLTDGLLELPSQLSEVVYLQLLAPDNSIIETQKIHIEKGSGNGEVRIDGQQGEGIYTIKAYSHWMLNAKDFLFKKEIPVYDFRIEDANRNYSSTWEIKEDAFEWIVSINTNSLFDNVPDSRSIDLNLSLDSVLYQGEEIENTDNQRKFKLTIPKKYYSSTGKLTLETKDEQRYDVFKELSLKAPFEHIDLSFFPEGGYLVDGITSNLAFKAIGPDGKSRAVEGVIVDEENAQVAEFKSTHLGMGFVPFQPKKGKSYKALLTNTEDSIYYTLPNPVDIPYIIKVRQSPEFVTVIVQENARVNKKDDLIIIAQSGNQVVYSAKADDSKRFATLQIKKEVFPEGITQFTVFSGAIPVSERLIFIEKPSPNITLSTNKIIYEKRDKVTIKVNLTDSLAKGIDADLSVSVVDITRVATEENNSTIQSHLLLCSDLKGEIEQPGYYFNKKNENRLEHLDVLMMTQGWSRFVWDSLVQKELFLQQPEFAVEKGLSLPGSLSKLFNENKAVEEGEVTLMTEGKQQEVYATPVNDKGQFNITDIDADGKVPVKLYGSNKKGKTKVAFDLDSSYFIAPSELSAFKVAQEMESEQVKEQLEQSKKAYQVNRAYPDDMELILLSEITVKDNRITEIERDKERYNKIYSRVDNRVDVDEIPGSLGAPTIFDLLRGRVPGFVYVEGIPGGDPDDATSAPTVRLRGGNRNKLADYPLFVIDGIISDLSAIISLNIIDIDHIDVLKQVSSGLYGAQGMNGVIAVYTKKGQAPTPPPVTGVYEFVFSGYNVPREFYSPDYSTKDQKHNKPDYRSTLYWNPVVKTDRKGNAELEFYTSDLSGKVNVEIQGLTENGEKIYYNYEFEVEE